MAKKKNFMSALAAAFGFTVQNAKPPNGAIPHEPEEEDCAEAEVTQEMLSEKFQKAMEAAEAHKQASENLTDVTSAGTLNVADVMAAKKKAGIG